MRKNGLLTSKPCTVALTLTHRTTQALLMTLRIVRCTVSVAP